MNRPLWTCDEINEKVVQKLNSHGYKSVDDVTTHLHGAVKVCENIEAILSNESKVCWLSGEDVLKKEIERQCLTTCSKELDELLNGGIELGKITEIYGNSGSGKSQLCIQLAINATLPQVLNGLESESVYIETNKNLFTQRLNEMIESFVEYVRINMKLRQHTVEKINEINENVSLDVKTNERKTCDYLGERNMCERMSCEHNIVNKKLFQNVNVERRAQIEKPRNSLHLDEKNYIKNNKNINIQNVNDSRESIEKNNDETSFHSINDVSIKIVPKTIIQSHEEALHLDKSHNTVKNYKIIHSIYEKKCQAVRESKLFTFQKETNEKTVEHFESKSRKRKLDETNISDQYSKTLEDQNIKEYKISNRRDNIHKFDKVQSNTSKYDFLLEGSKEKDIRSDFKGCFEKSKYSYNENESKKSNENRTMEMCDLLDMDEISERNVYVKTNIKRETIDGNGIKCKKRANVKSSSCYEIEQEDRIELENNHILEKSRNKEETNLLKNVSLVKRNRIRNVEIDEENVWENSKKRSGHFRNLSSDLMIQRKSQLNNEYIKKDSEDNQSIQLEYNKLNNNSSNVQLEHSISNTKSMNTQSNLIVQNTDLNNKEYKVQISKSELERIINQNFNTKSMNDYLSDQMNKSKSNHEINHKSKISNSNDVTFARIRSKLHFYYVKNFHEILALLFNIETYIKENRSIKLIVLDNITFLFHNEEYSSYLKRTKNIYFLLNLLNKLAIHFNLSVVIVNQLTTKFVDLNRCKTIPALGESYAHRINKRLFLHKYDTSLIYRFCEGESVDMFNGRESSDKSLDERQRCEVESDEEKNEREIFMCVIDKMNVFNERLRHKKYACFRINREGIRDV